jgi:hypothetical protein
VNGNPIEDISALSQVRFVIKECAEKLKEIIRGRVLGGQKVPKNFLLIKNLLSETQRL